MPQPNGVMVYGCYLVLTSRLEIFLVERHAVTSLTKLGSNSDEIDGLLGKDGIVSGENHKDAVVETKKVAKLNRNSDSKSLREAANEEGHVH